MKITQRFATILLVAATATVTATAITGCASTQSRESTGQYVDDTAITAKVKAAIFQDPDVKATEVNVETFKGVVQLSGFVASEAAMARAVSVTQSVAGVKSVKNDMRMK